MIKCKLIEKEVTQTIHTYSCVVEVIETKEEVTISHKLHITVTEIYHENIDYTDMEYEVTEWETEYPANSLSIENLALNYIKSEGFF